MYHSFHSCSDVQFGVEDLHTYAHLLGVGVNLHLCQGRVDEALEMGMSIETCVCMHVIIHYHTLCYRVTSILNNLYYTFVVRYSQWKFLTMDTLGQAFLD